MTLFQRFRSDQRGNVAILFGLALIPVVGMVGAAVDYSRAACAPPCRPRPTPPRSPPRAMPRR
jgi:Putative Flp pilus-assembly TadE/G-like